jgi:hypothetical protein
MTTSEARAELVTEIPTPLAHGAVDAQALETGLGRLGPVKVDADATGKSGHRELRQTQIDQNVA